MENNHPVLSALIRLHAELGGKIKDNAREAARLRQNMKHVEAVLKLLKPGFDTRPIAVRRRYNANPLFKRGTVFRAALGILRAAPGPLTADEIVVALFQSKGVASPSRDERRFLYGAVNSSLRNNLGKSVATVEGRPRRWTIL